MKPPGGIDAAQSNLGCEIHNTNSHPFRFAFVEGEQNPFS
jgi:hypothetical protein